MRTGNPWLIARIHSAGLRVKARSDLIDVQQSLGIKMLPGGKTPRGVALTALFDNHLFNYPYKEKIKQSVKQQTSRGLTQLTLLRYDYLILFNYSGIARIERLKDAVLNKLAIRSCDISHRTAPVRICGSSECCCQIVIRMNKTSQTLKSMISSCVLIPCTPYCR
jgi:hypothetical protein